MSENTNTNEVDVQEVVPASAPSVPVLTLGTEVADKEKLEKTQDLLDKAEVTPVPEQADKIVANMEDDLTEQELQAVHEFSKKIDLHDPNHVMLYGADAQKKISEFSDTILNGVKSNDTGEVGEMLTNLIGEIKGFESSTEKPTGIKALFTSAKRHVATIKARYEDVSVNVTQITEGLEKHQIQLLKDVSMFNQLYDMNVTYFHELSMYIVAGDKRLEEIRNTELKDLKEKATQSADPMDAQKANDLSAQCERFEKKLHDLKLTRQISMQMAPQIRLLQNNNALLVEKIQSTLVNTLPLWKNQMVLSLGLAHSQEAMRAQRAVTDMTNELLKKNAETLKQGTLETAQEAERGIVDIETLTQTNKSLIDTIDEVVRIQQEGKQKRIEAEKTLSQMEGTLKQKLLSM